MRIEWISAIAIQMGEHGLWHEQNSHPYEKLRIG